MFRVEPLEQAVELVAERLHFFAVLVDEKTLPVLDDLMSIS